MMVMENAYADMPRVIIMQHHNVIFLPVCSVYASMRFCWWCWKIFCSV